MEKKLKEDIVKAADSIRKKYRILKRGLVEEETEVKKRYEPLLKPLETIIDLTKEKWGDEEEHRIEPEVFQQNRRKLKPKKVKVKKGFKIRNDDNGKGNKRKFSARVETESDDSEDESEDTSKEDEMYAYGGDDATEDEFKKYLAQFEPLTREYMTKLLYGKKQQTNQFDLTFGVRPNMDNDTWWMGNKQIHFDNEDIIHIDDKMFTGTRGLFELLFKKIPDVNELTERDKRKYKSILEMTSAHKQGHHPEGRIASSHGIKYRTIISKLFQASGSGLLPVTNNKIDYIRWDDPNELVERLALLIASERAGNEGHKPEIASIEEELREANFIL